HYNGRQPDRQIDVEDPAPTIAIREPAAKHRPEHRRHDDSETPKSHRLAAVFWWKGFEHYRLGQWLERAAGSALNHAKKDQRAQARSKPAEQRRGGEPGDRG